MNCKILTINASGSIPKGEKVKGMGIPQKRRNVVDKVIRDECPDIIFIQESTIKLENFCTRYLKDLNYESIGPKDAGIIFDTSKFDFVEDPITRLRQIYESKVIREESADIFSRMCARKLKGKGVNAQPTLFVCWHGPHKEPLDEKKKLYDDFCLLLSLYASEEQIHVVVGGDFNLDLNKETNLEENPVCPDTLAVIDYKEIERRPNKIDFILTSPKVTVVDCKPVDAFSITKILFSELNELLAWFVTAILDHDPIVVNVIIPNQEEVTQTRAYPEVIENLDNLLETQPRAHHEVNEDSAPFSETIPRAYPKDLTRAYPEDFEDSAPFSETIPRAYPKDLTRAYPEDFVDFAPFSETIPRANPENLTRAYAEDFVDSAPFSETIPRAYPEDFEDSAPFSETIPRAYPKYLTRAYPEDFVDSAPFSETIPRANPEDLTRAYAEGFENLNQLSMTKTYQNCYYGYHLSYTRLPPNKYFDYYPLYPLPMTTTNQFHNNQLLHPLPMAVPNHYYITTLYF